MSCSWNLDSPAPAALGARFPPGAVGAFANGEGATPAAEYDAAIVGGGFSGAALAYHLARAAPGLRLAVFEPAGSLGAGIAYAVADDRLLLNVPAGRLSIDPDRPGDFFQWCQATGLPATPEAFLPRHWFGAYIRARLGEALRDRPGVHHLPCAVGSIGPAPGGAVVRSDVGAVRVRHATLALGNGPPKIPATLAHLSQSALLVPSPWQDGSLAAAARRAHRIVLIGTGLTMLDTVALLAAGGYEGDLVALSRRGLLPRPHGPRGEADHDAWAASLDATTARSLLRALRERCAGHEWRGVIDALRPHTPRLWASLPTTERSRFAHALAPYWDVHRHRAPPESIAVADGLIRCGRLSVLRARITGARETAGGLELDARSPGGHTHTLAADAVVLCTGPEPDPRRWRAPLVDALLAAGAATTDALGLGLRSNADGLALDKDGGATGWLSMLGPLRRGDLWESTAVPEISRQAAALARHIARSVRPDAVADNADRRP